MTEETAWPMMVEERDASGRLRTQRWQLSTETGFVHDFVVDIFQRYWDRLTFGPILDGIAYELTCPCAPDRFELSGGYLTVGFGGPHFHMCIGPGAWPDTPEGRLRMPGSASIFRSIDERSAPNSWSFELRDGAGKPMMSIYFDNPFLTGPDQVTCTPEWERLSMWRDISKRYLGLEPDPFDQTSMGFGWADVA
ncbi:MAG: hypothetical protein P0Y56_13140 [Candidatus Andeanibacterium colombiense]|uniref:Uncharacterized protein n=1 Tax=Candidatus Andeanibacterium colombiense TaxID=3121345 RepID=A0AAJ5X4N8_9SPHN|nr:MAG: hypothetical protein P0Y56_13140 [Sphingomonadaceae bacterium]